MKTLHRAFFWTILAVLTASIALAAPLGTGFTYQGQLNQNGSPVNGPTNLRFRLFDAATGGTQIGASQILANVPVANGLFTVELNGGGEFGANAFNGDARWLQIEVCINPGCTSSTILSPRQSLTATPYARYSSGPWQTSGSNISFSGGNVGVGTTSPLAKLDVRGDIRVGNTGAQFAARSYENLAILRGTIDQSGNIIVGSSFTVHHGTVGIYDIDFTGIFSGRPSVTVTPEYTSAVMVAMTDGVAVNEVRVLILRADGGAADDAAFHFTAIGPKF